MHSLYSRLILCTLGVLCGERCFADPPVLSYLFPAGAQRGTTVSVRVGGLNLNEKCGFELLGRGVSAPREVTPIPHLWFEGPILPLPESQQSEDYPRDMAAKIVVAADAPFGSISARVRTSQGVATGPVFVVGDLPEVVEQEIDGDPLPVSVKLPVTANGRVFPREDLDIWAVTLKKGETLSALASGGTIGSPVVPRLVVLDSTGTELTESGANAVVGFDASLRFTAPADGVYHVRIGDARNFGGPAHVYRLTLTTSPVVEAVFPLGGRRGATIPITLRGANLPESPVSVTISTTGTAPLSHRFPVNGSLTNPVPFDLDDLPEFLAPKSEPVSVPAVLNGRIPSHETPDTWTVNLTKGRKYTLELRARQLGSPLCGAISVTGPDGKELAKSDSGADVTTDPTLSVQVPVDGAYTVRIGERFRGRGGLAFTYRLRITDTTVIPRDLRMTIPVDSLIVPRGATAKLKVTIERVGGWKEPVELRVENLPSGITVAPATIVANQNNADLTFTATAEAPVKLADVKILGIVDASVTELRRVATVRLKDGNTAGGALAVMAVVPTPFQFDGEFTSVTAPRGQVFRRKYRVERNGFTGPLTVQLADRQGRHLQGVSGPTVVVPAGATEFDYSVMLPPWCELGRTSRSTLMATGVVKDADGTEHTVGFSSNHQNHQLIIIAEPGRLGLDVEKSVIRAEPGKSIELPVRISRARNLSGPVTVTLSVPSHWRGVSAEPITVPATGSDGVLIVKFANGAIGPFNKPATVRATSMQNGDPVTAEVEVQFLGR